MSAAHEETFSAEAVAEQDAPPGFVPLPLAMGFIGLNGPIFMNLTGAEPVFGVRVLRRMCNPLGVMHGGMVATMLDMTLPLGMRFQAERAGAPGQFMLTVNLTIDYLAGAKEGDWLEGRARVLKRTKRLAFIDGLLTVEGDIAARGSGVFRLSPEAPPLGRGAEPS